MSASHVTPPPRSGTRLIWRPYVPHLTELEQQEIVQLSRTMDAWLTPTQIAKRIAAKMGLRLELVNAVLDKPNRLFPGGP